jgi:hypothetical protein
MCSGVSLFPTRCAEGQQTVNQKNVAEEVYRVGDKGSGDAIMVNVETILDAIFCTWVCYPQLPQCQGFQSISFQIKGILL